MQFLLSVLAFMAIIVLSNILGVDMTGDSVEKYFACFTAVLAYLFVFVLFELKRDF